MDPKWYRQTKFVVAGLALAAAVSLGAAAYVANSDADYLAPPGSANQCDLPLAQRTGGWVCPTP